MMLSYVFSFITKHLWGESDETLPLEEIEEIIRKQNETADKSSQSVEAAAPIDDHTCYHKTGFITSFENGIYTIDNVYQFQTPLQNLAVGMEVSFTIYLAKKELKVVDVAIKDDWGTDPHEKKLSWCTRSLIGKVVKRKGREIEVEPGGLKFDLDNVSSEFIPVVGDWVQLEGKSVIDEKVTDLCGKMLEVERVRPLRPRIVEGRVKTWNSDTRCGSIDKVVYFNVDSLQQGYTPMVGDTVVAEAIESEQGMYSWRALKVVPDKILKKSLRLDDSFKCNDNGKDVFITGNLMLNAKRVGEKLQFSFEVKNHSGEEVVLNVQLQSKNAPCAITNPLCLKDIKISPKDTLTLEGMYTVRSAADARELLLFVFKNFQVSRWVIVKYESYQNRAKYADRGSIYLSKSRFKQRPDEVIKGQRISATPRFVSARLPEYPIPEKLSNIFNQHLEQEEHSKLQLVEKLKAAKPCLNMPLSFNIYEDRFHTLIHLEEINQLNTIKSYSQDETVFIKNGDYLMLEIENLSEKRPSLIVGDKIFAKDVRNADATEFEGIIHKVGAKHLYLKFAAVFHHNYNGEVVCVMAVASRTSFRRMHQAVGLAVRNLGFNYLFPSKIVSQKNQVSFTYDEYSDDIKPRRSERFKQALLNKVQASQNGNDVQSPESDCKSRLLLQDSPRITPERDSSNLKLKWNNRALNFYQKEAVRNILLGEARPLPYFIFGPPGTGKTVTLVEVILQLLQLVPHSRILVATPSNSAADLIAIRLIESGTLLPGDLIRLVAYRYIDENRLPERLVPYCATADISREGTNQDGCRVMDSGLTLGCNSTVIGRHRITVGTCMTLGILYSMGFSKGHFTHVIVDEAGQCTEPEAMIPFSLLDVHSGQIILAGDPLQLGPVVCSKIAVEYGLEETFLDRMMCRFPYSKDLEGFPDSGGYDPRLVTRLIYNYRSLPNALFLCSDMFYDGQLIATISPDDSKEAAMLESIKEILPCRSGEKPPSIVFIGVVGENFQDLDCPSWYNPSEASQIFYYVNELYRLGLKSTDVGIISPYIKQVRQIRAILNEAEFDVPKVGTVEEFQGQEFNVILLSTVRSSNTFQEFDKKYKLGFVSNPRRLNVALSRAQILTVIVGDPYLLQNDAHWRTVIKHCIDNGSYKGCVL